MNDAESRAETTHLPPGAGVLIYTDGLADSLPSVDASTSRRLVEVLADPQGRTFVEWLGGLAVAFTRTADW
jgi:hypothetical protein